MLSMDISLMNLPFTDKKIFICPSRLDFGKKKSELDLQIFPMELMVGITIMSGKEWDNFCGIIQLGKEMNVLKRIIWIVLFLVVVILIVFVFNLRSIEYCSKQILSQNIKEFTTLWQPQGRVRSFEATYRDEDLRLARLVLGSSPKHVRNLYGIPLRTKNLTAQSPNNADYTLYCTYWIYPDFEVGFENSAEKTQPKPKDIGHIFVITVKSKKFHSFRGIKVGDPISRVMERYGVPSKNIYDDFGSIFYEEELCYIKFGQSKGKVSEIELGENAD
jgi:hypothetical protein